MVNLAECFIEAIDHTSCALSQHSCATLTGLVIELQDILNMQMFYHNYEHYYNHDYFSGR